MMMNDICIHLNRIWKSLNKLEFDCRVDFSKFDAIPELVVNDGKCILDSTRRSMLLKRIRMFKLLERYTAMIEMAEYLGHKVHRDNFGMHSIV